MAKHNANELFEKYNAGNASDEERAIVESWFLLLPDERPVPDQEEISGAGKEVWAQLNAGHQVTKQLWSRLAAAASIIICMSLGSYFYFRDQAPDRVASHLQHDIHPGRNEATLTLSNGQKIKLTRKLIGNLMQSANAIVTVKNNNIYYQSGNKTSAPGFNILSTAKGEKSPFPLVLPDGTKVWLNALSSIRFPTDFNGRTREVMVTGEAYFEVVHDKNKPFKVMVKNEVIEDIGTHFNINAYDNEPVLKTTLLEGRVKVSRSGQTLYLNPGESAKGSANDLAIVKADVQTVTAWKDGYFNFHDADIPSVMRQIARWYDVDIQYEGNIPSRSFNGELEQNLTLEQVLKLLSYTSVHFRIEGKKIIVTS
ncbi:FecR family protein [Mucilaginibacter kameinonensis]|uniref:FecR family protein n=1 Tax=Mucilaginibacter kameinonensis TaxID=452286 RepID=UPI000EF84D51|nr:FecR family protein [Mucilaginibacter kameinonensis]